MTTTGYNSATPLKRSAQKVLYYDFRTPLRKGIHVKTGLRAPWLVDPKFAGRTLVTLRGGPPKENVF